MRLPTDTRAGTGYTAAPVTLRGTASGAGGLTLTTSPVPQGYRWLINYVTITADGAAVPTVNLYVDEAALPNLLDGTTDNVAVAPYNPARVLDQGQRLLVVWTGATVGAHCSVRIEYDVEPAT